MAAGPAVASGTQASPARAAAAPPPVASNAPLSPGEKFARDLYENCKMVNPSLAMWLNGSFEVLQMEDAELVLGFQRKMPMDKVDTACRPMVEQQAEVLLGRKVALRVTLMEGDGQPRRETRRGHLAEAARAMGATQVGKE